MEIDSSSFPPFSLAAFLHLLFPPRSFIAKKTEIDSHMHSYTLLFVIIVCTEKVRQTSFQRGSDLLFVTVREKRKEKNMRAYLYFKNN